MSKPSGSQFRQSQQLANTIVENLPNLFPVEEWRAFYWTREPDGALDTAYAIMHLPRGLGAVTERVAIGEAGIVEHVRRWGVTLRGGYVQNIGLDLDAMLSHDRTRFSSDDAEALHLMTLLTHFDLPGHFIIASQEHPFLLFDPAGDLKGSDTRWFTQAGALAYLVSDGQIKISFDLVWQKDKELYDKVMQWLNDELEKRKR
ncbi:MAG: hypothetical protein HY741_11415 [Chloroflexi bacterium]|nr:hypothetical protein [Chloroflexota bacterium]